jgi:hypothetical protein
MIVLSDTGFHAAEGDPSNLKLCPRGEWEDRMLVETVLSMLTLVCHLKKVMHRGWAYFQARLAFTMAAFNVLVQWHGFRPNCSDLITSAARLDYIADFDWDYLRIRARSC